MLLDNEKHIIYKESSDRFTYEIQRPTSVEEYTFDTTFGSVTGIPGVVTEDLFLSEINSIEEITLTDNYISYYFESETPRIDIGYLSPNGFMIITIFQSGLMASSGDFETSKDIGYELLYDYEENSLMVYSSELDDFLYVDYASFVDQLFIDMDLSTSSEFYSYFVSIFTEELFDQLHDQLFV